MTIIFFANFFNGKLNGKNHKLNMISSKKLETV